MIIIIVMVIIVMERIIILMRMNHVCGRLVSYSVTDSDVLMMKE